MEGVALKKAWFQVYITVDSEADIQNGKMLRKVISQVNRRLDLLENASLLPAVDNYELSINTIIRIKSINKTIRLVNEL